MDTNLLRQTKADFQSKFERQAEFTAWGPGRVNLIGEHTDYNNGFVLPLAVDRGVFLCGGKTTDGRVSLYSSDYDDSVQFEVENLQPDPAHPWANYFKGVLQQYLWAGGKFMGCQAAIRGDLPKGAGLSSSAALEVACAVLIERMRGRVWDDLGLVKAAQAAENQFVGVQCGIMDPFASYMGRESDALLLDCRDLAYQWVPLPPGVRIVVCDTGVKRVLASSAYNQRRAECAEAVRILQFPLPRLRSLRDLSPEDFRKYRDLLPETVRKRCRHVVTENQRALEMVEALKIGDLAHAGQLMNRSHQSLRDDYEVSCRELDLLAEAAQGLAAAYGGRMMGGGFGGCTVNLVMAEGVEAFRREISSFYQSQTGRGAESSSLRPPRAANFSRRKRHETHPSDHGGGHGEPVRRPQAGGGRGAGRGHIA